MFAPSIILVAGLAATSAEPGTLRLDYVHSGNAAGESFALTGLTLEGPWPGPADRRIDDTNLGKYLFEVVELKTNRPWYSRGFASVYGEWETTAEARELPRAFGESLRFPEPAGKVQVVVKKRDEQDLGFREVFTQVVDPKDMFVDTSTPASPGPLIELQKKGDPAHKVDLLILGDGRNSRRRGWRTHSARAPRISTGLLRNG